MNRTGVLRRLRLPALAVLAFAVGHFSGGSRVVADPQVVPASNTVPGTASVAEQKSDYSQRVVAYIHGNVPITREDFGEYLIARQGVSKLEHLVNLRIIETACKKRGLDVTQQEIEAALEDDLVGLNIKKGDFVKVFLKEYGKTLYEWKQDVIRPRLLLSKMVRDQIQINEEEVKQIYEHRYGKKVKARIILWPKGQEKIALQQFAEIRKTDADFDRVARGQADATLAAAGGEISPVARFGPGDNRIFEDESFKLNPGELSRLIDTPTGMVVIKCIGFVEADKTKDFDKERPSLVKEVVDRKLSKEIPKVFELLKAEAKPQLFLKGEGTKLSDLEREAYEELQKGIQATPPMPRN